MCVFNQLLLRNPGSGYSERRRRSGTVLIRSAKQHFKLIVPPPDKRVIIKKMLNFNQSDPNVVNQNFSCQMDGPSESSNTPGNPSAYSAVSSADHQPSAYNNPLMANFNSLGSGRGRNASPGLIADRFFDHNNSGNNNNLHDHQTPDTIFPFVVPSSKGSENVKRFSVNNLLQLAQCTSATNLLSSARSLGK